MIQENYVTFEQAKALKELGFPQERPFKFFKNGELFTAMISRMDGNCWTYDITPEYSAPTLSLVQKWLREEKKIILWVEPEVDDDSPSGWLYDFKIICPNKRNIIEGGSLNDSPDSKLSAGIDKCIEILKK